MKKIPTLFARNHDGDKLVRDEVTPGCEWVLAGEGVATRKFDGTCCLVQGGVLYKRHELRPGKAAPPGFVEADRDATTGKVFGWLPVGEGPEDRWHREAVSQALPPDGTYELCGPKVQGNPEGFATHLLVRHGEKELPLCPCDFAGIKTFLAMSPGMEGVVWHHPDGRMAKIKRRDFKFCAKEYATPVAS